MKNKKDLRNNNQSSTAVSDEQFISELYHNIDMPEPAAELDHKILNAARRHQPVRPWWQQAGSWAAGIIIASFVGILSFHSWQAEQQILQQESSDLRTPAPTPVTTPAPASIQAAMTAGEVLPAGIDSQATGSARGPRNSQPAGGSAPTQYRARKAFRHMSTNDTRQLNFNRPQAAAAIPPQSKQTILQPALIGATSQQTLTTILRLIKTGQLEKAGVLLSEYQKKYPQEPVDPVILRQLAPYQLQNQPFKN